MSLNIIETCQGRFPAPDDPTAAVDCAQAWADETGCPTTLVLDGMEETLWPR